MKRAGGRMSYNGVKAVVFGATGFVGQYVVNHLGRSGVSMVIPSRGDDMEWRHLKPLADNGRLAPRYFSPRDEASVSSMVEGADVVVNMIGKHYETRSTPFHVNYSFNDVHVNVAETIARVSKEGGVKRLIHVSALGLGSRSSSEWAKTKAEGETVVLREFPEATIVRPSIVYGPEDRFLNLYAQMATTLPKIPLVDGGGAKVQPVYAGDLGVAIARCVLEPWTMGRTFEFAGEEIYTLKEIVEFMYDVTRMKPQLADISPAAALAAAWVVEKAPNPMLTCDQVQLMQEDIVLSGEALGFDDFGIKPASMERKGLNVLNRYRAGGHFEYIPQ